MAKWVLKNERPSWSFHDPFKMVGHSPKQRAHANPIFEGSWRLGQQQVLVFVAIYPLVRFCGYKWR